jgi:hypothetical protein
MNFIRSVFFKGIILIARKIKPADNKIGNTNNLLINSMYFFGVTYLKIQYIMCLMNK